MFLAKNKGADTVQLICVFVFAYTKIRFSHDAAQLDFDSGFRTFPYKLWVLQRQMFYTYQNSWMNLSIQQQKWQNPWGKIGS